MNEGDLILSFDSSMDSFVEYNSSFDLGILRICYTGRNRNGSFISKEVFEQCMPSIFNCPVVCRYDREMDEIGEHDVELVKCDNGGMRIVNVTQPVGVVPSGAKYWWETITDNGVEHEYLCVEAIVWKRQEAYRKIKECGTIDQSMEISVKEGEMIDGVYVIRRFEFLAFCLLGTAEPCYESASLELFSANEFKTQFAEMMSELKESFSLIQSPGNGVDIKTEMLEGGINALEEKNELIAEFGFDATTLDFNIEDISVDELREKLQALTDANQFALAEQFRENLLEALRAEREITEFGETNRYWYVDHDPELSEVYCEDIRDWNLYGMTYSLNGDVVVIDFESKKRKKFSIVDFDEGEQGSMKEFFELAVGQYKETKDNAGEWERKFNEASAEMDGMRSELDSLAQFKSNIEKANLDAKRNEVFAMFEDLSEVEAFISLRENCESYSLDELEEKCYALRGRHGVPANFSVNNTGDQGAPKLPAGGVYNIDADEDEPYGGVFKKFGFKAE